MYGGNAYGQTPYGSDQGGASGGETVPPGIEPPLVSAAFTVYPPAIGASGALAPPLVAATMQVFPPESIAPRGRPLAEDIRIMRVRRSE
jgi:hypothetical protein